MYWFGWQLLLHMNTHIHFSIQTMLLRVLVCCVLAGDEPLRFGKSNCKSPSVYVFPLLEKHQNRLKNDLLCAAFLFALRMLHTQTVHLILYHCSMPQRITIAFEWWYFLLVFSSLLPLSPLARSTCSQYTVAAGSKLESEKLHHRNLSWNVLLDATCTSEMAKACDNQQEIILLSFYYLHRMLRWLLKDEVVVVTAVLSAPLTHSLTHTISLGWCDDN